MSLSGVRELDYADSRSPSRPKKNALVHDVPTDIPIRFILRNHQCQLFTFKFQKAKTTEQN